MAFNIENSIMSRKGEQAKIHESGQLCIEILHLLTSQLRLPSGLNLEENVPTDMSVPVKKEEIDLLEKALEKALQVRSGSKPSVTRPNIVKPPGTQNEQCAATKDAQSTYKGQTKNKLLSKTTERKDPKKYQTTVCHTRTKQADGFKSVRTNHPKITLGNVTSNKLKALSDHGQPTLPCGPKKQTDQLCGKNLKAITVAFSKTIESDRNCLFQHEEMVKWTNLKHRENRLWDKIIAFETKSSTSKRELFMAKMRGTFPMSWPCGSPEKIQSMVHRLIQQGQDLPENRQSRGGGEDNYDSAVKFDRLKITLENYYKCAVQLKTEWKSWDRWRPEWGCLCPIGTETEWHEGRPLPLPKTVTYTKERELTELETLRMRVLLLEQEAFAEKILSDTLSPHLSSAVCATLNPRLLRELYSVLGEGGERFPAIVLNSEPHL